MKFEKLYEVKGHAVIEHTVIWMEWQDDKNHIAEVYYESPSNTRRSNYIGMNKVSLDYYSGHFCEQQLYSEEHRAVKTAVKNWKKESKEKDYTMPLMEYFEPYAEKYPDLMI